MLRSMDRNASRSFFRFALSGAVLLAGGCTWESTRCHRFEPKVFVDPQEDSGGETQALRNMRRWSSGRPYGLTLPVEAAGSEPELRAP